MIIKILVVSVMKDILKMKILVIVYVLKMEMTSLDKDASVSMGFIKTIN